MKFEMEGGLIGSHVLLILQKIDTLEVHVQLIIPGDVFVAGLLRHAPLFSHVDMT